jgi:hypothetical protein
LLVKLGRKIYYDKYSGNVLVDTGEMSGDVRETTTEEDFAIYTALSGRNPATVGCLRIPYGQDRDKFAQYAYHVDPTTEKIVWDLTPPQQEEEQRKQTLDQKVSQLERESIDAMLALTQVYEELLALKGGANL